MPVRKRLTAVLFWSVISAAFIGPGTLVTASTAGSVYGLSLLWALVFATLACIIFQEMASRLTLVTGNDLASTLRAFPLRGLISVIPLSVVLGCMAYEAGNLQGAAVGLSMIFPALEQSGLVITGFIAAGLLAFSAHKRLVLILGFLVAAMGLAFLVLAVRVAPPAGDIIGSLIKPAVPSGSEWLVIGLIGTTVVPYNLFLGSGISKDSSIGLMRFGLTVSIVLGGIISMAILITGTLMNGATGLNDLITVSSEELGVLGSGLVAFGLFAAGLTSAITAPLAAGLIIGGFYSKGTNQQVVRIVSVAVVIIGMLSGLTDFRPEVIILTAQSLNGLVLPLVAAMLWLLSNQSSRMKGQMTSGWVNVLAYILLNVLIVLGTRNLWNGIAGIFNLDADIPMLYLWIFAIPVSSLLGIYIMRIRAAER